MPLRVAHVWSNQDNPTSEATLVLAATKTESRLVLEVCDRIKGVVQEQLSDLQKKYKPPKITKSSKKSLDWSIVLKFTDPVIVQTPDKVRTSPPLSAKARP